MMKAMKNYLALEEEVAKQYGPVTLDKLEIKITELNTVAGELKPVQIKNGAKYHVSNVSFSIPYEQWKLRDKVLISFNVTPAADYMFGDNMKVECKQAESAVITGTGQERTVTLKYSPYTVLGKPTGLYVDSNDQLHWDKVENATSYIVEVPDEENDKLKKIKVTSPVFDIADYKGSGATIKISSANKANSYYYVSSSKVVIDNLDEFIADNSTAGKFKKVNGRIKYIPEDGEVTPGWNQLGGFWYFLDIDGYAAGPGWWQDKYTPDDPNRAKGGSWYYFDQNCRMLKDTVTPDGYKLDSNGRWVQ